MRFSIRIFLMVAMGWNISLAATPKTSTKAPQPTVKNPWGFAWDSENIAVHPDPNEGDADGWISDNYFKLSYKANPDFKVWAMQLAHFNYFEDDNAVQGDFVLGYNLSHGKIPGEIGLSTQGRLYLPISQSSKDIGQHQFRYYINFAKPLSSTTTLKAEINPRVFGYTKHESGQLALKWQNTIGIAWAPLDVVSFGFIVGHVHYGRNSGKKFDEKTPIVDREDPFDNDDAGLINTYVSVNLTDNINVTFLVEQERDLRADNDFEMFATEETLYFLNLGVSI